MFTVCPKCTLTLVVTTVDLRAGQGYVRCGRCANVFNALIALREGDPASGTSDTARRRLMETAPASVDPARGVGVAMDPEPEPEPEPAPEAEIASGPASEAPPEPSAVVESEAAPEAEAEAAFDFTAGLEVEAGSGAGFESEPEPEPEPEFEQEPAGETQIPTEEIGLVDPTEDFVAEESSLEFDAAATDVSEIFISPSEAEHDTVSGNYEAVILEVDPPLTFPPPVAESAGDDPAHTDTVARSDWSLLDDDEPLADDESVIEESPLTYGGESPEGEPATPPAAARSDPAWVEQMFAEAEAQALAKVAPAPERAPHDIEPGTHEAEDADIAAPPEPAAPPAARGAPQTAPSDAAIAPLLGKPDSQRPRWQYVAGVAALVLLFALQVAHFNRRSLALSPTFGPMASHIYGWFGVVLTPRWDLTAYSVRQLGAESEDAEGKQLRVRLSLHNESARVQPFPLLRLTLLDRFNNPVGTRDIEPADYLPKTLANERLLEPDQRIDTELHVLDPTKAAMGFVIDACLRASNGNVGCTAEARSKSPPRG